MLKLTHFCRHIIRQLVNALHDCIKCGVLHRDVKLENILFNPETMDITLIDFGCGDYVRTTPYKGKASDYLVFENTNANCSANGLNKD